VAGGVFSFNCNRGKDDGFSQADSGVVDDGPENPAVAGNSPEQRRVLVMQAKNWGEKIEKPSNSE
jgi:hypothetical protein